MKFSVKAAAICTGIAAIVTVAGVLYRDTNNNVVILTGSNSKQASAAGGAGSKQGSDPADDGYMGAEKAEANNSIDEWMNHKSEELLGEMLEKAKKNKTKPPAKECNWTIFVDDTVQGKENDLDVSYNLLIIAKKAGGKDTNGTYKGRVWLTEISDLSQVSKYGLSGEGGWDIERHADEISFDVKRYSFAEVKIYMQKALNMPNFTPFIAPQKDKCSMALFSGILSGMGQAKATLSTDNVKGTAPGFGFKDSKNIPFEMNILDSIVSVSAYGICSKKFEGIVTGNPLDAKKIEDAAQNKIKALEERQKDVESEYTESVDIAGNDDQNGETPSQGGTEGQGDAGNGGPGSQGNTGSSVGAGSIGLGESGIPGKIFVSKKDKSWPADELPESMPQYPYGKLQSWGRDNDGIVTIVILGTNSKETNIYKDSLSQNGWIRENLNQFKLDLYTVNLSLEKDGTLQIQVWSDNTEAWPTEKIPDFPSLTGAKLSSVYIDEVNPQCITLNFSDLTKADIAAYEKLLLAKGFVREEEMSYSRSGGWVNGKKYTKISAFFGDNGDGKLALNIEGNN